jgi:hypothetical protein
VSPGNVAVAIEGAALTAIDSACVADAPSVSETLAVKLEVPVAAGVPVIVPVDELRESPAGNAPEEIDQVNAPVPPVAVIVWL